MLSAVLLQPADLLKTRVQQNHQNTLLATIKAIASGPNPIRQFWRGTLPSTLRTGCGSAIYFSGLNALRRKVSERASLLAGDGPRVRELPAVYDPNGSYKTSSRGACDTNQTQANLVLAHSGRRPLEHTAQAEQHGESSDGRRSANMGGLPHDANHSIESTIRK